MFKRIQVVIGEQFLLTRGEGEAGCQCKSDAELRFGPECHLSGFSNAFDRFGPMVWPEVRVSEPVDQGQKDESESHSVLSDLVFGSFFDR